jgi:hypothetical protein
LPETGIPRKRVSGEAEDRKKRKTRRAQKRKIRRSQKRKTRKPQKRKISCGGET